MQKYTADALPHVVGKSWPCVSLSKSLMTQPRDVKENANVSARVDGTRSETLFFHSHRTPPNRKEFPHAIRVKRA